MYKKTAKDLAHEEEVRKLKSTISDLRNQVSNWKERFNIAMSSQNSYKELYESILEEKGLTDTEYKSHIEATKKAAALFDLFNFLKG